MTALFFEALLLISDVCMCHLITTFFVLVFLLDWLRCCSRPISFCILLVFFLFPGLICSLSGRFRWRNGNGISRSGRRFRNRLGTLLLHQTADRISGEMVEFMLLIQPNPLTHTSVKASRRSPMAFLFSSFMFFFFFGTDIAALGKTKNNITHKTRRKHA